MSWYYANNDTHSTRYYLGTRGKKHLLCLGITPGEGTPEFLDETILKVEQVAFQNGFDSWIMMNIYPQISVGSSSVDNRGWSEQNHRENLKHIKDIFDEIHEKEGKPVIWAAWGAYIEEQNYFVSCLQDIAELARTHECRWITFGLDFKGVHPAHPLDIIIPGTKEVFLLEQYLRDLQEKNA